MAVGGVVVVAGIGLFVYKFFIQAGDKVMPVHTPRAAPGPPSSTYSNCSVFSSTQFVISFLITSPRRYMWLQTNSKACFCHPANTFR